MNNSENDTTATQKSALSRKIWRVPSYRIEESEEAFQVRVEVPGVSREYVNVSVEDDLLSIRAVQRDTADDSWKVIRKELSRGGFRLDLRLNAAVDQSVIAARVKNGVLNLDLPKSERFRPRRIEVN